MVIKMYVSGISASKEVKKRQQRALMILESIKVPFESIDITEPGKEEERDFMKEHCKKVDGVPTLPPHFFNEKDYCGDFDDFDQATEEDRLIVFLKLDPAEYNINGSSLLPEGVEPIIMPGEKGEGEAGMVNGSQGEPTGDHVESMEVADESKEEQQEVAPDEGGTDEKGEADDGAEQGEEETKEDVEEKKDDDDDVPEADAAASKSIEDADNAQGAEDDEEKADDDEMKPADEPTEEEESGDKEDIEDDGTEKEE